MRIVRCLETALGEEGRDNSRLGGEVVSEATCLDFRDDASRFILFRLLLCLPWSARVASDDIAFYTVSVTGALFDLCGLENSLLRPVANIWGYWCIRWGWRLGNAWRKAFADRIGTAFEYHRV